MNIDKASVTEMSDLLEMASDDEVFRMMSSLEDLTDNARPAPSNEIFAKIALVETEIERRHPGQLMAPYKAWKQQSIA